MCAGSIVYCISSVNGWANRDFNSCLETFLRCMCSNVPHEWYKWLALAEWWYNTTYHNTIKSISYEVVYGQQLPLYLIFQVNQ